MTEFIKPPNSGPFSGLRGRFLLLVITIFLGVGTLAAFGFFQVSSQIINRLGANYAEQYANQTRARILAKVQRELVLTQKLVDSPLLLAWANDESNAGLKKQALSELESYRRLFADKSFFFAIDRSKNYYFNNAANEFAGRELQFQLDPAEPSLAWYFATLKYVENFDLHVDNSAQLGVTKVWVNAIVRGANNEKLGVAGTGIELQGFLRDIVQSNDPGVEVILVDENGFIQGHSDVALMQANAKIRDESKRKKIFDLIDAGPQREQLAALLLAPNNAANGRMTMQSDGVRRLGAISYMPELKWAAIVLVNPSQLTSLNTFRPILIVLAAALLATVLLVSWLLNRLVLRRLGRLSAHTQVIAQQTLATGQNLVTLTVDRPDEIGQLTHSFNHMTTTLGDYMLNLEQKVSDRTADLQQANAELAQSNRKIMDSIEYAKLIQNTLLPKAEEMQRCLGSHTLMWLPRDLVGGDFYALYPLGEDGFMLAVGDCTGHGVPGAFMTMAAKATLDRAVEAHGADQPAAVLLALHTGLRALLQTEAGSGTDNGLDLALITLLPERKSVIFAGAKLELWALLPGAESISVSKGDRLGVGYQKTPLTAQFTQYTFEFAPGTRLFVTTDGLLDQNGGARGIGLGKAALQQCLLAHRDASFSAQAIGLSAMLAAHQGNAAQRDDITLLGFAV